VFKIEGVFLFLFLFSIILVFSIFSFFSSDLKAFYEFHFEEQLNFSNSLERHILVQHSNCYPLKDHMYLE
jgi:hypothetical protein